MIDIHCHILPAFDDGADALEDSLEMAAMAVSSGVAGIVATPHFPGVPQSLERVQTLMSRFGLLQKALERAEIPLRLYPGAEIQCFPETADMARRHLLPTIGSTRNLLVEFDFDESPGYMLHMLDALLEGGYTPVVAHPERYRAVQLDPMLCRHWFEDMDCIIQLNKGSLLGAFGGRVRNTARFLGEQGLVHVVASDAHSPIRRTPHMTQIRQWLEVHFGPDNAELLLSRNPACLVAGRPVSTMGYETKD